VPSQPREKHPRVTFKQETEEVSVSEGVQLETPEPAVKKFKLSNRKNASGDVNFVDINLAEGIDKHLQKRHGISDLLSLTMKLLIVFYPLWWVNYLIWNPIVHAATWVLNTRIAGFLLKWLLYVLMKISLRWNRGKHEGHHHHGKEVGDCLCCKMIGNRYKRGKSDRYCSHTWREHKFVHLKRFTVR